LWEGAKYEWIAAPGPLRSVAAIAIVAAQLDHCADIPMTIFKSGDFVVLKSGGPTMTVDTVNTDIFDDNKITGVLCVWFVEEKLERVRFDHRAIEHLRLQKTFSRKKEARSKKATGDYKAVLDEMVAAMNPPTEERNDASKVVLKQSKPTPVPKHDAPPASPFV
jgi:uncharacterized protein YodC (DUF2158 family)